MPHNGQSILYNSSKLKLMFVVLGVIFLNEHLIYVIQSYRWPSLPIKESADIKTQVVLIVADPQIQGYQDEPIFPIGTLARWDIDRYLWKTFQYAYNHCQPDVIVFLGDLFDEGSKATPREYTATLDRFYSVFPQTRYIKTIYIPGDNDIGGEGRDLLTYRKAKRFEEHFGNTTDLIKFGFVDYMKMDIAAYGVTEDKVKGAEALRHKRTSPLPILLNHISILPHPKHFVYPVTRRLRPKVILTAHWHKSVFFTCDDCLADNEFSWNVKRRDLADIDGFLSIPLRETDFMCEIAVPTCSYRMGMKDMGYGLAIISEDLTLQYTVLWLPRRYTMLLGYLILILIYGIVRFVLRCTSRR